LLVSCTHIAYHTGDPNRNTIDPDSLIKGSTDFLMENADDVSENNPLNQLYEFFARYVRKLHADLHIKNTLEANPGTSFLEMIGPSDVAYVITLLKNSKDVWMHDPTDKTAVPPKQLYTRGESKKRTFGKSTMSEEGIKFFNKGVKNWKMAFNKNGPLFESLQTGWETWLNEDASVVDSDIWRRKNIRILLSTRPQAFAGGEDTASPDTDIDDEIEMSYDSDGDVGRTIEGRRKIADDDDDDDDEEYVGEPEEVGGGEGEGEDDKEDEYESDSREQEEEETRNEEDEVDEPPPSPPRRSKKQKLTTTSTRATTRGQKK
jgi:hypothetical protein